MSEAKPKGAQGKRYSPEQKAEILAFIKDYDAKNKRGGLTAAASKFGVSVVTLSNWKNKGGKSKKAKVAPAAPAAPEAPKKAKVVKAAKKPAVKKKAGRKPRKAAAPAKPATAGSKVDILTRMQAITVQIAALEKEFEELKKKL